jgi:hypothetical protein
MLTEKEAMMKNTAAIIFATAAFLLASIASGHAGQLTPDQMKREAAYGIVEGVECLGWKRFSFPYSISEQDKDQILAYADEISKKGQEMGKETFCKMAEAMRLSRIEAVKTRSRLRAVWDMCHGDWDCFERNSDESDWQYAPTPNFGK